MRNLYIQKNPTPVKKKPKTNDNVRRPLFLMPDKQLLFIMLAFVLSGLIFTYSSSAFDTAAYFKRQVVFDIMGLLVAAFLSQFYLQIQKRINPMVIMAVAWILLIIVLFTPKVANVHRWINLGFFNLQPSEVAKPAIVIYMAYYLANISVNITKSFMTLVPPLAVAGATFFLMMLAPELGAPALMFSVVYLMLFVAGAKIKHLLFILLPACLVLVQQLIFSPYRLKRLLTFLAPEANASDAGYQLYQSFLAIGSGGWLGKGLGNSQLKLEYLPAAHTDFIFSIMAEEVGLFGVLLVIGGFIWLLVRGISISRNSKNAFNSMLALGITLTITLQAFFNMGVATGLLPTKGLPLPFFSYGGSSVMVTMAMMGILFNLASQNEKRTVKQK
ncbi:cell division protein FtsW [Elusimicrobium posterum]|uniref:putative lipid II flippase FtsW n=1 Tax=Elusimicrobium posterum TaxID=3116653 RepID=UPI003C781066